MASGFHPPGNIGEAAPVTSEQGVAGVILHQVDDLGALDSLSLTSSRPSGGSQGAVAAEFPFAVKGRAEWAKTRAEESPFAGGLGAIRGFVMVMVLYLVLAAVGVGGFLLWHWLR